MERPVGTGRLTPDLAEVAALYAGSLRDHGLAPRGVGWRDPASQLLRFQQLAFLIAEDPDAPASFTANDLGCGYGAMFSFLVEQFGSRLSSYHGYEISAEMLEAARGTITDPRATFIQADQVELPADYTFVSGTFHVKLAADEASWSDYVKQNIRALAQRSRRGFAFNLLTDSVDWREQQLYYADPAEYLSFCRSQISRRVVLLHDYPLHEWTMVVRTGEAP